MDLWEQGGGERRGVYQTAKGGNRIAITPSTKSELFRGIAQHAGDKDVVEEDARLGSAGGQPW
jgi:hypothetical protein